MNIADLLHGDRVVTGVTASSRKHALDILSELLAKAVPGLTQTEVFNAMAERERLGSTGLGGGIALPHGRLAGVDHSIGAFVRLEEPIDWEAIDERHVDLLFGLLVPEDCRQEHLDLLRSMARQLSDEPLRERLRIAADGAEALDELTRTTPQQRATG